jgi:hypothetical protein
VGSAYPRPSGAPVGPGAAEWACPSGRPTELDQAPRLAPAPRAAWRHQPAKPGPAEESPGAEAPGAEAQPLQEPVARWNVVPPTPIHELLRQPVPLHSRGSGLHQGPRPRALWTDPLVPGGPRPPCHDPRLPGAEVAAEPLLKTGAGEGASVADRSQPRRQAGRRLPPCSERHPDEHLRRSRHALGAGPARGAARRLPQPVLPQSAKSERAESGALARSPPGDGVAPHARPYAARGPPGRPRCSKSGSSPRCRGRHRGPVPPCCRARALVPARRYGSSSPTAYSVLSSTAPQHSRALALSSHSLVTDRTGVSLPSSARQAEVDRPDPERGSATCSLGAESLCQTPASRQSRHRAALAREESRR